MRKLGALRIMLAATASVTGCLGSAHSPVPALNDKVRDGKFAFIVTTVNIGVPKTGYHAAQGVFVVVNLMVKNIGDQPRSIYCQNQKLLDPAGKRYDDVVTISSRDDQISIPAGTQVHVSCAFDVPKGTLPAAIEVHDSPYSRGVTVQVLGGR